LKKRVWESSPFVYCDPPYIGAKAYTEKWAPENLQHLINILLEKKTRFAISEFDSSGVLDILKPFNLNVIDMGERRNIKNRRTEILITNY
jgi:hypothetical protein